VKTGHPSALLKPGNGRFNRSRGNTKNIFQEGDEGGRIRKDWHHIKPLSQPRNTVQEGNGGGPGGYSYKLWNQVGG